MIDVEQFVEEGYVKVEQPALRESADRARTALWHQIGWSPDDPGQWSAPVKWVSDMTGQGPFGDIVRSPTLAAALDRICGANGWLPRGALGNIPVRFPVSPPGDDRGWHIDANTPLPDGSWAVSGRPQTVLLLTLLSEVGDDDAPTRIRAGSHRDVGAVLGADALDPMAAGPLVDEASAGRPVRRATGGPGDMYIVHPFTVHAADEHRGREPRFMAQGPVMLTSPVTPATSGPLGCVWDT